MGVRIRQRKEDLANGKNIWFVFANIKGARFSLCAGSRENALHIQRVWHDALQQYKADRQWDALIKRIESAQMLRLVQDQIQRRK